MFATNRNSAWEDVVTGEHDGSAETDADPVFTFQDEEREIASLTMNDMVKINADLLGVTADCSRLNLGGGGAGCAESGTDSFATQSSDSVTYDPETTLSRLELELNLLSTEQTSAYRRAEVECPAQVSDERKMAFVERESGDVALAASRLARHWKFRLAHFGGDKCFQPLTLAGAMIDEVIPMIKRKIYQVSPVTDSAGRTIIFVDVSKRNYVEYSAEQEIMSYLYILETILDDSNLRRRGIVFLSTGKDSQRKHFNRKFAQLRREAENCSAVHVRGSHLCHPSTMMQYVIYPIIKYFMPRDFRLRFRLHNGTVNEVLRGLEGYCLPRDKVPTELGGEVNLDMNQWVLNRMVIETSRISTQSLPVVSAPAPVVQLAVTSPAEKPRNKRRRNSGEGSKQSSGSSAKAATTSAKLKEPGKKRTKGKTAPSKKTPGTPGRPSDPRMIKAVQAKIADPSLPLDFVLEEAGFSFREDPETGIIVDQGGIACKQRKNQLCRRIRQERDKKEG